MLTKVILTVKEGEKAGQEFVFDSRGTLIIGRADDCNLQLTHTKVSRYHCLLDINPPEITVRDLGSTNGTFLNGDEIGKRPVNMTPDEAKNLQLPVHSLQAGDVLKISDTLLEVGIKYPIKSTKTPNFNSNSDPGIVVTEKPNLLTVIKGLLQRAMGGKEEELLKIEGYSIEKKLGVGAFGEVYLAKHARTADYVAIKVMLPEVAANPRNKEKFMRELENTRALHHPNIVQLREYGFSDGIFFFTLEYCESGNLEEFMQQRTQPLTVEEAIPMILQVLEGLEYAHSVEIPYVKLLKGGHGKGKGLVHRDIKPSNLLLKNIEGIKGNPIVKIADFGIAKAFDQAGLSGLERSGMDLEGTYEFMPREQAMSFKYAQPDVDVWSTVACLYYMLTRKTPRNFSGKDPLLAVLQTNPIPIRQYNQNVPEKLAELIDFALMDYPQLRFKNAIAFKQALLSVV